jgi:hypothetical protein
MHTVTANGLFTGVFQFGGNYGHLEAYPSQIILKSVSDLELVDRVGLSPSQLSSSAREKVCH